jgi:hypothetical protein
MSILAWMPIARRTLSSESCSRSTAGRCSGKGGFGPRKRPKCRRAEKSGLPQLFRSARKIGRRILLERTVEAIKHGASQRQKLRRLEVRWGLSVKLPMPHNPTPTVERQHKTSRATYLKSMSILAWMPIATRMPSSESCSRSTAGRSSGKR